MPVCPRQCHFGCVLVGIEHGVHEREARVALDAVAWLRSPSKECHCRPTVTVSPTVPKVLRWSLVKGLAAGSCHHVSCRCEARRMYAVERALLHR